MLDSHHVCVFDRRQHHRPLVSIFTRNKAGSATSKHHSTSSRAPAAIRNTQSLGKHLRDIAMATGGMANVVKKRQEYSKLLDRQLAVHQAKQNARTEMLG